MRWLACLLVAFAAVAAAHAADDDSGFCPSIQEILKASRTDFDRWRGKARDGARFRYDATRTLPRAFDCRIERESADTRYTCEWEYRDDEEAAARAATARFLDGILDCLGDKVQQVQPYAESTAERRRTTLLIVRDDADSAELRVSSRLVSRISTWSVTFSANRRR